MYIIYNHWYLQAILASSISTIIEEIEVLKEMVERTFANGSLNKPDTDGTRKGFYPDFAILIVKEDNLHCLFLNDRISVVEGYKHS